MSEDKKADLTLSVTTTLPGLVLTYDYEGQRLKEEKQFRRALLADIVLAVEENADLHGRLRIALESKLWRG